MVDEIFKYKGKTLEELKQMDVKKFAGILTSRKRRSLMRDLMSDVGPLMKKVRAANQGTRKKQIKTHSRTMIVMPEMVGLKIGIHNGKDFTEVIIVEEMIGLFFGELSPSRRRVTHGSAGVGATKSSTSSASKAK